MSFLDSLENSLKSLESQEERDPNVAKRRQDDRQRTLEVAPWADKLKNSAYTKELFEQAAVAGHRIRAKIYMAWVDTTLRLEVRGRTLELKPTAEGIVAEYRSATREEKRERLDLDSKPSVLLEKWLAGEKPPAPIAAIPMEEE